MCPLLCFPSATINGMSIQLMGTYASMDRKDIISPEHVLFAHQVDAAIASFSMELDSHIR